MTKERFVELIEAYAAAKAASNPTLMSFAAQALSQAMEMVEFPEEPAPSATDDFVAPEPVATPNGRTRAKAGAS